MAGWKRSLKEIRKNLMNLFGFVKLDLPVPESRMLEWTGLPLRASSADSK